MGSGDLEKAVDPNYSAWISASAGTGKTKLLTDRIVNLLISGVNPESIVCITFTNAAKGEMISRINASLQKLESLSQPEIAIILRNLNIAPSKENIEVILSLAKNYQIHTEKVQIFTIHGFCQSILTRFPIEAGLKPNFQVIDDVAQKLMIEEILFSEEVIAKTATGISDYFTFYSLKELIYQYLEFFSRNTDYTYRRGAKEIFAEILSFDSEMNLEEIFAQKCQKFVIMLESYKDSDIGIINYLYEKNFDLEALKEVFFTKALELKKRLITKDIKNRFKALEEVLSTIQGQVAEILHLFSIKEFVEINAMLIEVGEFVYQQYILRKLQNNLLDYDDLIRYCYKLICNSDLREWIKFKLDQNFDHILVDESQDTSESQWNIIKALIEDFFSGENANTDKNRTIFIVGDVKQSIYAFQGARPDLFFDTMKNIKIRAAQSRRKYIEASLQTTYRIPTLIFSYIKNLFQNTSLIEEVMDLECYRKDTHASLEIWDLEESEGRSNEKLFWPMPEDVQVFDNKQRNLAKKIASYIKRTIDSGLYIESKARPVRASDFLILVQRRSSLNRYLFEEIQKLDVEISGLDRIILNESLVVMDILSVLRYIIDSNDKLNLFSLLKSQFFNLSEKEIYAILKQGQQIPAIITQQLEYLKALYASSSFSDFLFRIISYFNIIAQLYNKSDQEQLDALAAFLDEVAHLVRITPDLSAITLINLFDTTDINVKRDFSLVETVRVNTVHGAKGLESPIIIIADASYYPASRRDRILEYWFYDQKLPILYRPVNSPVINSLKEADDHQEYEEYLRLLYVALTRVQDHIIICGVANASRSQRVTWYELCKASFLQHHPCGEAAELKIESNISKFAKAQEEKESIQALYRQAENIPISAIRQKIRGKFHFSSSTIIGNKTHAELEALAQIRDFNQARLHASKELEGFFSNPDIERIFRLKKIPEAEIIDNRDNSKKILRIDLIAFNEENKEVIILDYKTDIQISASYHAKLIEYHDVVQHIYASYQVRTYIYWIKHNRLEEIMPNPP